MAVNDIKHKGRGSKPGSHNHWWVHGESHKTPEHSSWQAMKARCLYPKHQAFHRYGGRGIKVCDRWLGKEGYQNFVADMGRRPSLDYSLDRINQNGDYTPSNCRWATRLEQQANQRSCVYIDWQGSKIPVSEAARIAGLAESTLRLRISKGWTIERAMTQPARKSNAA